MKIIEAAALALIAMSAAPASAQAELERAVRNYLAVIRGEVRLESLSPRERAEVAEVDRRLRAPHRPVVASAEQCREDEIRRRGGGQPSALESDLIDLACSQR